MANTTAVPAAALAAQDGLCAVAAPLASAVSGSESSFTAAAAASLADAWWQSEQQQQQQQVLAQSSAGFAPSCSAGTGATCIAASSSCDDESVLDSLLIEAINQSLAGTASGTCSAAAAASSTPAPAARTTTPAPAAAAAAAADLEATDEELEEMIMQELAAAGIAISTAGALALPPAAGVPAGKAVLQPQQQQHACVCMPQLTLPPQQQLVLPPCSTAGAMNTFAGSAMPLEASTAGLATPQTGNGAGMGAVVEALQQQAREVERMLFELKQLRDTPAHPQMPAAAAAGAVAVPHGNASSSAMFGSSAMTGVTGWHGCF
jgi:hypothetical protein